MLYALRDPLAFVVLVASFVLASTLAGWSSTLVGVRTRAAQLDDAGRRRPDPRRHLDPFGCVAAALTGVGWWRAVPLRHDARRGVAATTLAGPAVLLLVAAGCLLGVGALGGRLDQTGATLLQVGTDGDPQAAALALGPRVLLLVGLVHLFVGLLSLVPLPPLEAGRLLFARAPRTAGWQKAEGYLVEKNLGTVAVLVLLLLPLAGQLPLLLALLTAAGRPLVSALTGVA